MSPLSPFYRIFTRVVIANILLWSLGGLFLRFITGSLGRLAQFTLLLALLNFMFMTFAHLDEDAPHAKAWALCMSLAVAAGILIRFLGLHH